MVVLASYVGVQLRAQLLHRDLLGFASGGIEVRISAEDWGDAASTVHLAGARAACHVHMLQVLVT